MSRDPNGSSFFLSTLVALLWRARYLFYILYPLIKSVREKWDYFERTARPATFREALWLRILLYFCMIKKIGPKKNKAAPIKAPERNNLFLAFACVIIFVAWLAFFVPDFVARAKIVGSTAKITKGLSDDQRRDRVYGSFYKLMQYCSSKIPENATVFIVINSLSDYYYGSYYLYPRRVLIGPVNQPVDGLSLQKISVKLNKEFCRGNNISYIINVRELKVIKVD